MSDGIFSSESDTTIDLSRCPQGHPADSQITIKSTRAEMSWEKEDRDEDSTKYPWLPLGEIYRPVIEEVTVLAMGICRECDWIHTVELQMRPGQLPRAPGAV